MVTVNELRKELIKLGLSKEEADSIKGKTNLANKINELSEGLAENMDLDSAEVIDDDETECLGDKESDKPSMGSPEWNGYVLSLLTKDEKIDKNPTVDGLRRVTELVLGKIVNSYSNVAQVPTPENKERATVVVTLTVQPTFGPSITAQGSADSYYGNTEEAYRNYPVAVAETRAEGRALRRLLKLRKILAAEEKVADASQLEQIGVESTGKITQPQIQYLEITCRDKLGINITKFVNKHLPDVKDIKHISHAEALDLFKVLSSYQATGVPEDLKGYDNDWKTILTTGE